MSSKQQKLQQALELSPHKEFGSDKILNFVINNFQLGEAEFKMFKYVLGLSNNCNGVCFPSGNHLAKAMEVSRPRVVQLMNKLKEKGLLFIQQLEKGQSNFYIIPTLEHLQNVIIAAHKELVKKAASNIKSVMEEVSEKASKVVESVQEVVSKVTKVVKKFTTDRKPTTYDKKPIRKEMLPAWFGKEEEPNLQPIQEVDQDRVNALQRRLDKFKK
jgi:biotin operon repressor